MTDFTVAFNSTFLAVFKVFLVVLGAGILVRRGILSQAVVTGLSNATVNLFLPCMIFSMVIETFHPEGIALWWLPPIVAFVMPMVGLIAGAVLFLRELPEKKNMLALASMQNAGYLVLPVGFALYPDQFDRFALYCFLFIFIFNIVLWSIGKKLVTDCAESNGWRGLVTPPLVANLTALTLALSGARGVIPSVVLEAIDLVGQAAVPVATVVLGAILGGVTFRLRPYLWDATRVVAIKLGLLPLITVLVVHAVGLDAADPLLARFLVLEAAAAPASGIVLQVRTYGGDEQKVGSLMLVCYGACLITMPFWLAVLEML